MRSIQNIHEITKAMEMIAGFRFKKAEHRFLKARPFFQEMERLAANLAAAREELSHPLFEKRKIEKKVLVLLTGDKGLCGAYNSNLMKAASAWLQENKGSQNFLVPLGKVGYEYFRRRQASFLFFRQEKTAVDLGYARKITEELKNSFLAKKLDSIELLYTSFRVGGTGRITRIPFLNLDFMLKTEKEKPQAIDYIYEPDFDSVFESLLARLLEGKVYVTLLESLSSEYCARMIAMKQATENGEEVLDNLTLLRNKTRQASITRELSEIVGGASVLV